MCSFNVPLGTLSMALTSRPWTFYTVLSAPFSAISGVPFCGSLYRSWSGPLHATLVVLSGAT